MKRLHPLFFLVYCLLAFGLVENIQAQPFGAQSLATIGGNWDDKVKASAQDSAGNVIILGTFYFTADFDPGPGTTNLTSSAGGRIYMMKLDTAGNLMWAKNFGNNDQTAGEDLALDDFGNVYVTGQLRFSSDFDPGPGFAILNNSGSASARDCFIAKYDSLGNFKWVKSYGNASSPVVGRSVAVAPNNQSIYVTGQYAGTTDFDPSAGVDTLNTSGFTLSGFIQKLDSAGNHLWVKPIQTLVANSAVTPGRLVVDHQANLYLLGNYFGTADFDPDTAVLSKTSTGPSGQDFFISKMDSSGALLWNHSMGASNNWDFAYDMMLAQNGDLLVSGGFGSTVDFDPGPATANLTSNGFADIFLLRLSNAGNFVFAKGMGDVGSDVAYTLAEDELGNILLTGNFRNTVDFDPGSGIFNLTANPNTWSLFLAKFDASGNFLWAEGIKGSQRIYSRGLHYLGNQEIFVTGEVDTVYDFDPSSVLWNNFSNGEEDIFLYRVKECTADTISIAVSACESFDFIGQNLTASGVYVDTLRNALNCDSIITLNLTILNPSFFSFSDTACLSYSFAGQTLVNSGVYTDTLTNQVGCDSIISLNLTVNQPSSVAISQSACDAFIFSGDTLTSSGVYTDTLLTQSGCDSIVTLNLNINSSQQFAFADTACFAYNFNGQNITNGGSYTDTLQTSSGCDSVVTLNLTLNGAAPTQVNETACRSFAFAGRNLTASGTYFDTLAVTGSCDSLVQLNLTVIAIDTNVSRSGTTLSANQSGATYQWIDCATNTPVTGANNRSFTPTANGSYAVIMSLNTCTDTSACTVINDISLSNAPALPKVELFPNPTSDLLTIKITGGLSKNSSYVLTPANGQRVQAGVLYQNQQVLDLSALAPGLYFLELKEVTVAQRVFSVVIE